jgi:hypothetical protein
MKSTYGQSFFSVCGGRVINNPDCRKRWCILKNETLARSSEGTFQLVETPHLFFFSFWFLRAIPGEYIMVKKINNFVFSVVLCVG